MCKEHMALHAPMHTVITTMLCLRKRGNDTHTSTSWWSKYHNGKFIQSAALLTHATFVTNTAALTVI
jgi:hypothetical protein